jgi:hypothetical protein
VLVLCLLTAVGMVAGCGSGFGDLRLSIATGSNDGVYYQIGTQLAGIWATQLGIPRPTVISTAGTPQNLSRLLSGTADVGFASADAISETDSGPNHLRALARIYEDYIQVVVRANEPVTTLAGLAGRTVSVGPGQSQVQLVADRILSTAGVDHVTKVGLNLDDSIRQLKAGKIDAFFWSGGLPTQSITQLAASVPIRLLNLGTDPSGVLNTMLDRFPVYGAAPVPAATYGVRNVPVTTLTVPNFLLVTDRMPDDVAEALVRGLFDATGKLAGVNSAALAIDVHSAIYTQPVPLHPGAEAYYRSTKM